MDRLLADPLLEAARRVYGSEAVATYAREALAAARGRISRAGDDADSAEELLSSLPREIARTLGVALGAPAKRVLNATGIFLHTNLGRAPLPRTVARNLEELSTAGCDLEFDLAEGRRGNRGRRLANRLRALTGAPDALVVNNNAAALLLALAVHAAGREVLVSRGELVEIGGSFRVPEILEASGARLREVGTTNRTRLEDYGGAVSPATGAILKVHPSNYRMSGFTESVTARQLVPVARAHGLPLIVDEGAGLLRRPFLGAVPERFAAGHESVADLVAAGADLVCASGDKLLGGPQAGILVGGHETIAACASHPLYRALRPGRLVALALDEVLCRHLAGDAMPIEALWPEPEEHAARVQVMARRLGARIEMADAFVGGGAAPEEGIPGPVLALPGSSDLAARLREGEPPVVGYLREGSLRLDLRTIDPRDDAALVTALEKALAAASAGEPEAST